LSSFIRSNNINFLNEHVEIKNDFVNKTVQTFKDVEESEDFSIEQQKEIIHFEMEQERNKIINEAIIAAKVEAKQLQEEILANADSKANEIIAEAENILNKANQDKNEIENNAFEQGYDKGYNEALSYIEQANSILSDVSAVRESTVNSLETEIVSMIQELFKKVIGMSLDTNSQIIINLIKKTLNEFGIKHSLVLKVSSEDYENVLSNKNYILSEVKGIDDFDIVKAESLKKGDCIVQTQSGEIDSSISTQLKYIDKVISQLICKKDGLDDANSADYS
jgi:flagellar assembly protein FliH